MVYLVGETWALSEGRYVVQWSSSESQGHRVVPVIGFVPTGESHRGMDHVAEHRGSNGRMMGTVKERILDMTETLYRVGR